MKKISITAIILGILFIFFGILPFFIPQLLSSDKPIGIIGGAESAITEEIFRQLRYNLWSSSCYPLLLIIGAVITILGIILLIVKLKK